MTDMNDWLREGEQRWELVKEHGEIIIPWNNPWYRFASIAVIGLLLIAASLFWPSIFWAGIIVTAIGTLLALPLFISGFRVRGIAAFVSTEGCGIGCGYDRLFISWEAVAVDREALPINDQFMLITIKSEATESLKIRYPDGTDKTWDRLPYKRSIIRAVFDSADKGIRVYANPNEIMVHFLSFLYPVMAFRAHAGIPGTS